MLTKKKKIFIILIIVGLNILLMNLWLGRREEQKVIIKIDGFEVEYSVADRILTMEDIDNIELNSSLYEICNELGEPDTCIGSGMIRPVYFLEDNMAVVFFFKYPACFEELRKIVVYRENGECQIIKESDQ